MALIDDAIGLWQAKNYSGSGDWLDESGNGYDLTPSGSPSFTSDGTGPHWALDGTDDRLRFLNASDELAPGAGDFTVLMKLRTPSGSGWISVDTRNGFGAANDGYQLRSTGADFPFVEISDGVAEVSDQHGTSWPDDTPFTVGFRLDRTAEELEVILNGEGSGSPTDTSTLGSIPGDEFDIGVIGATYDDVDVYWVAVFDSALTDAQAQQVETELESSGGLLLLGVG